MFTDRLIEKTAILLATLWAGFAVLVAVELLGHLLSSTSEVRSQLWRGAFIAAFVVNTACLLIRFAGWRWILIILCALVAIRDYFYLTVPREFVWGGDQISSAVRLAVALATLALALSYEVSARNHLDNKTAKQ